MTSYTVVRSTTIAAPPARVHALIDDFREWVKWSPWEELDPDLERHYSGADSGEGAVYAWSGNKKAGQGTMSITSSTPERIVIDLTFVKPFRSSSTVTFDLEPAESGTELTWTTAGEQGGVWGLALKVYPMDKVLGGDMENGLARLRTAGEG